MDPPRSSDGAGPVSHLRLGPLAADLNKSRATVERATVDQSEIDRHGDERYESDVNLPEDIARHLQTSWHDLSRGAPEAIALEGYRSEALTRDQVARLLGMSFWVVEAFLKERRAYLTYSEGDLEDDHQAIDQLRRR